MRKILYLASLIIVIQSCDNPIKKSKIEVERDSLNIVIDSLKKVKEIEDEIKINKVIIDRLKKGKEVFVVTKSLSDTSLYKAIDLFE